MAPVRLRSASKSDTDEVLFKLIVEPETIVIKPPRYVSKMGWKTPPTASTFGPASTSQLNVTNLKGSLHPSALTHIYRKPAALFGPGNRTKADTKRFLKKANRVLSVPGSRPECLTADRRKHLTKSPIPSKHERPIQGLVTNKNFIKANAIEMMLSEPIRSNKKLPKDFPGYHPSYGKVPEYLDGVKREVALEYEYLEQLKSKDKMRPHKEETATLDDSERLALLSALKSKWNEIQHQYQGITHHVVLDTIGQVRKKEKYERDLAQLETDIKTLSKQNVLIRTS